MEGRQGVVDTSHPLRHSHVVGVLSLELEFEEGAGSCSGQPPLLSSDAAVRRNSTKRRVPIRDQPKRHFLAVQYRLWRPKDRSDEVIVEKGRAQSELCLLKRKDPIVTPRALLERGIGNGTALNARVKSLPGLIDVAKKLRTEQTRNRLLWFECANFAEDFPAIISCHPYGSDFSSFLIDVEVGRAAHVNASVGQIHCALGIARKMRQKFFARRQNLKRLVAGLRNAPRNPDIVVFAEHTAEGVTRKRSRAALMPSQDHSCVQSSRKRHPNRLDTAKVAGKIPRE